MRKNLPALSMGLISKPGSLRLKGIEKMKKNIILFVLDGVSYFNIGKNEFRNSPTPYIDSLREKSVWATKCYSQGPFTESGIIGLLFGQDTMNDGGYFINTLRSENNLIHLAHQHGYKTFLPNLTYFYPPACVSFSEYASYSNCYDSSVFVYKIRYYAGLHQKGQLDDTDIKLLVKMLDFFFLSLQIELHPETARKNFAREYYPFQESATAAERERFLREVARQHDVFKQNPEKYVIELLDNIDANPVFPKAGKRPKFFKKAVSAQKQWVYRFYKEFFKKLPGRINNGFTADNSRPGIPDLSDLVRGIVNLFRPRKKIVDAELNSRMLSADPSVSPFCFVPSAQTYINSVKSWIDTVKNEEEPYFAYLHFEDTHYPWSFYSSDLTDKTKIREEFSLLDKYRHQLPDMYKGEIRADFSYLYVDNCIREFISSLEQNGEMNNTVVIITADHGISNAGKIFRKERNNNFFDETYHIPLIIYNPEISPRTIDSFVNSKDIAMTILDICNIPPPGSFSGLSVLDDNFRGRQYTTLEYIGFGMPDMRRRPITFSYRDDDYNIVYSALITDEFPHGKILEVYNLKEDPMELCNLVDNGISDSEAVSTRVEILKQRFSELKVNYAHWLSEYTG